MVGQVHLRRIVAQQPVHGLGSGAVDPLRQRRANKEPAEALAMLRRSLHLRAALGARPQTVAAQALLADHLAENDPVRVELLQASRSGARELRIGWLLAED
ncbi:hypothetical protein [Streptomyces collinus]|uniref:hypothetical protein n=1 Tax=Streptomyces collinus TaxID=42684 RepID=UPI003692DB7D